MITYTTQLKILKDYFISFKNNKKTYTKLFDSEIKKYKNLYNYQKFETLSTSDFKFLVLMVLYQNRISSLVSLIKYLNNLSKDDIQSLINTKDLFVGYQYTLKNNTSSPLTQYRDYLQTPPKGRIQQKKFDSLSLVLDYFPKIKQYIHTTTTNTTKEQNDS